MYFKFTLAADKARSNAVYVKTDSKSSFNSDSENNVFKIEDSKSSFQSFMSECLLTDESSIDHL